MTFFKEELGNVKGIIEAALLLSAEDEGGARPLAPESVLPLRRALETGDVGTADRLIEELAPAADRRSRSLLIAAADQILISDYDSALELIGRI
jgi:hypothetical protein